MNAPSEPAALSARAVVTKIEVARIIRAKEGDAFLGRMNAEQSADDRRQKRMERAGDA